jgi:hypothetical protein
LFIGYIQGYPQSYEPFGLLFIVTNMVHEVQAAQLEASVTINDMNHEKGGDVESCDDKSCDDHLTVTREERLHNHRVQCQNLKMYLMTNILPQHVTKKEARNIKNQAKTHQWDGKSKIFGLAMINRLYLHLPSR